MQNEVIRLSDLRLIYIKELDQNGHKNDNYRSEKLLKRLQNNPITEKISFTKMEQETSGILSFWLIYRSQITVANALSRAYTLGNTDKLQDVALLLRGIVCKAFKESEELPCPPTPIDLVVGFETILPPELSRFLSILMTGKDGIETSEKVKRLVLSIGQDLCRVVTDGKWKLPKHLLLCVKIRHLYRSKQLTMILNRLGHSETYKFGLELETKLAKALDDS